MRFQGLIMRFLSAKLRTQCELVSDTVGDWMFLEYRGRDPRFEDEPAAEVNTADLFAAP